MMSVDDSQNPVDKKTVSSPKKEGAEANGVRGKEKPADAPEPAATDDAAAEKPVTTPKPQAAAVAKPTAATDNAAAAAQPPKPQAAAAPKPAGRPAPAKKPPVKGKKSEPPPTPPEFEKGISDKITARFGDGTVESTFIKPDRIGIRVGRENVHEVAEFIRDELNYDHVESVSGVDYAAENEIEVVYHIGSYTDDSLGRQIIALSTRAQREDDPIPGGDATRLPSLRDVFYSVEFHEREIFEMFGVYFEGHPDNRRLLLPEDWADLPPLRKDFAIKGR